VGNLVGNIGAVKTSGLTRLPNDGGGCRCTLGLRSLRKIMVLLQLEQILHQVVNLPRLFSASMLNQIFGTHTSEENWKKPLRWDRKAPETGRKSNLCCLQPRHFRIELKTQLRALVLGEPVRHLREDGSIERDTRWVSGELLRRPGFGQNLVQFGPQRVRIRTVFRRGGILAEQVGLFVILEKVALTGHIPHDLRNRIV
jgi:hypothetical protein